MRLIDVTRSEATVRFDRQELGVLCSCLAEAIAALDPVEFAIRVGAPVSAAQELLRSLNAVLDEMDQS